jgi:DNA-binding LacI/PurR family transcriptional regulator
MLLRLINEKPLEMTRVVLPTHVVERESCRAL